MITRREYLSHGAALTGGDLEADYQAWLDEPLCWLPGHEPRKKPAPKPPEVMAEIRARAWATRRRNYGVRGHR